MAIVVASVISLPFVVYVVVVVVVVVVLLVDIFISKLILIDYILCANVQTAQLCSRGLTIY